MKKLSKRQQNSFLEVDLNVAVFAFPKTFSSCVPHGHRNLSAHKIPIKKQRCCYLTPAMLTYEVPAVCLLHLLRAQDIWILATLARASCSSLLKSTRCMSPCSICRESWEETGREPLFTMLVSTAEPLQLCPLASSCYAKLSWASLGSSSTF